MKFLITAKHAALGTVQFILEAVFLSSPSSAVTSGYPPVILFAPAKSLSEPELTISEGGAAQFGGMRARLAKQTGSKSLDSAFFAYYIVTVKKLRGGRRTKHERSIQI